MLAEDFHGSIFDSQAPEGLKESDLGERATLAQALGPVGVRKQDYQARLPPHASA